MRSKPACLTACLLAGFSAAPAIDAKPAAETNTTIQVPIGLMTLSSVESKLLVQSLDGRPSTPRFAEYLERSSAEKERPQAQSPSQVIISCRYIRRGVGPPPNHPTASPDSLWRTRRRRRRFQLEQSRNHRPSLCFPRM